MPLECLSVDNIFQHSRASLVSIDVDTMSVLMRRRS